MMSSKYKKLPLMMTVTVTWLAATTTLLLAGCSPEHKDSTESNSNTGLQHADVVDTAPSKAESSYGQAVKVVRVEEHQLDSTLELPGNLEAYQDVPLHAKVEGYISWIGVDRGSTVHKGQRLITITAPEVDAKVKEAASKVSAADANYKQSLETLQQVKSRQVEAQTKLDSDQLTLFRLKEAGKTPGAIAQNDIDMAQKTAEGDQARVNSLASEVQATKKLVEAQKNNVQAASQVHDSLKAMSAYLDIKAPFDGVITERNVHEGSIVAVDSSREAGLPLLRIQEKSLLRLVVAVPEACVSGIKLGEKIPFSVPAFIGKTFYGTVARPGFALDTNTRTMPVELNVPNANGELEPGMFATVQWMVTRPYRTLFLPQSAVASDLKGTFVVRVRDNIAERVPVKQGQTMGKLVEVIGDLKDGDLVALKATDEIKSGTKLTTKLADKAEISAALKHSGSGGE